MIHKNKTFLYNDPTQSDQSGGRKTGKKSKKITKKMKEKTLEKSKFGKKSQCIFG